MDFVFTRANPALGGWWLISPYDAGFVDELKSSIPWPERKWHEGKSGRKAWWIADAALETAKRIANDYGRVVVKDRDDPDPIPNQEASQDSSNVEDQVGDWFHRTRERVGQSEEDARWRREQQERERAREREQRERAYQEQQRRAYSDQQRREQERRQQHQSWSGSGGSADPYRLLHLLPTAPLEVVTAAYKALARKEHPDTTQDPAEKRDKEERMKKINVAHETIMAQLRGRR